MDGVIAGLMGKRYGVTWFAWHPSRDLLVVASSWSLVVFALFAATFIATPARGILYFLLYGIVGATLFGIGIPLSWMVLARHKPLSSLGITKTNLSVSLGVQVVLSVALYAAAFAGTRYPPLVQLLPLMALSLAIGFFEAVFWRGWVFLRLEEAFGLIPAVVIGSLMYAAYHVGYGMPLSEMVFLFFIGVLFAVTFRITKNVFILWPLFQPLGQLTTLVKDGLLLPPLAAIGFLEALAAMAAIVWLAARVGRSRKPAVRVG